MAHSPPDSSTEAHTERDEHDVEELEAAVPLGDLIVRGVFVLLGVLVARRGFELGLSTENGSLGAGMLPAVVGSTMVVLAAALLLGAVAKRMRATTTESSDSAVDQPMAPRDDGRREIAETLPMTDEAPEADAVWKRWINVAGLVALAAAIPLIGLAPAVGAYVLFVSLLIERWKIVYSALFAVIVGGAVWFLFQELLAVPVPTGTLW
ncbi:tripartite tricarboxylate transporter TctB family protein [Georgenia sp. Z1491]|uniref:tripartite tricarboxylate transporter TctB family protein n=1 Tax=Georgenia sp. Z1491 TaxID=3416707 RepID=UPI003CE9CA4E